MHKLLLSKGEIHYGFNLAAKLFPGVVIDLEQIVEILDWSPVCCKEADKDETVHCDVSALKLRSPAVRSSPTVIVVVDEDPCSFVLKVPEGTVREGRAC